MHFASALSSLTICLQILIPQGPQAPKTTRPKSICPVQTQGALQRGKPPLVVPCRHEDPIGVPAGQSQLPFTPPRFPGLHADCAVAAVGAATAEIIGRATIAVNPTFLIISRRDIPSKGSESIGSESINALVSS